MSKTPRQITIDTYNNSAKQLADYFVGIGPRTADIELAIELSENRLAPRIFEIGCGDGRDAEVITAKAQWYEGMDPSSGLLQYAKNRLPDASFKLGDITNYEWPHNLDVVFAFASLLHLSKDEIEHVFRDAYVALQPGGVFYVSLKYMPEYTEVMKHDEFGDRQFFFYTPEVIKGLVGPEYEVVFEDHQQIGNTRWFSIAFKKPL